MSPTEPVVTIQKLRVATNDGLEILRGIDLALYRGEIHGLMGATGSGKTTLGHACLGYLRPGVHHVSGRVVINPVDGTEPFQLLDQDADTLRSLRGRRLAYIPHDPAAALDPAMRVGDQLLEVLAVHHFGADDEERHARIAQVLAEAGLPHDATFQQRWPHELRADQPHRVALAMAFALTPDVVVCDESTSDLDLVSQARLLETFRNLTRTHNTAGLVLTRAPVLAASMAARVAVLDRGEIVTETDGTALSTLDSRSSQSLVGAGPEQTGEDALETTSGSSTTSTLTLDHSPSAAPETRPGENLIAVHDLTVSYRKHSVLDGISLGVAAGECTFVFGDPGAGKTTLGQTLAGLLPRYQGTVTLRGKKLARRVTRRRPGERRNVQYLFSSPRASFNPHHTIGYAVAAPLATADVEQRRVHLEQALDTVQLEAAVYDQLPAEVSTENLQRAALARALVNDPAVLVCDDITAELDPSAQASMIALLNSLRASRGLTILFLSRDIRLARQVATRLAVLHDGQLVEHGTVDEVLENPAHSYTQAVLNNVMEL